MNIILACELFHWHWLTYYRYIGTLHEINSETHTVALESVTSYGTEGRKGDPSQEIPGSDQVYEYIVFRGSDVKELTIVAPPSAPKETQPPQVPNDPAILGVCPIISFLTQNPFHDEVFLDIKSYCHLRAQNHAENFHVAFLLIWKAIPPIQ